MNSAAYGIISVFHEPSSFLKTQLIIVDAIRRVYICRASGGKTSECIAIPTKYRLPLAIQCQLQETSSFWNDSAPARHKRRFHRFDLRGSRCPSRTRHATPSPPANTPAPRSRQRNASPTSRKASAGLRFRQEASRPQPNRGGQRLGATKEPLTSRFRP